MNEIYKTLTLEEAAAFLMMSPAVLRQKAKAGIIKGAKPGKRWVFLECDLAAYLRSLYPEDGQASQSGCKEVSLCHSTNAATPGGFGSQRPTEIEYANLLGLKTEHRHKNITTD